MIKNSFRFVVYFLISVSIFSCKKEDHLPLSVIEFSSTSLTLVESGDSKNIDISFSLPLRHDGNLVISISDSTAVYGRDYVTIPEASSNTITIPVVNGATSTSFIVVPVQKSAGDGDKVVNFIITGLPTASTFGSKLKQITTVVDDDLVCYLPMNGNAKDVSHYASPTQVEGAILTIGRNSLPNSAYLLDGISNDIVIPTSTVLDTIQRITLAAWIKPVSFYGQGNNSIIEKAYYSHVNPYYQYKLGITGDQYPNYPGTFIFSLSINGSYNRIVTPNNSWTPGNWYFVVGTYDGTTMNIYVNGNLAMSTPMTGKIDNWGTDIYLGKGNNANVYTPGTLGDIRIYNRALSAEEVASLHLR